MKKVEISSQEYQELLRLKAELELVKQANAVLRDEKNALEDDRKKLQQLVDSLMERGILMAKKIYGRSSEKNLQYPNQLSLFNEAEVYADATLTDAIEVSTEFSDTSTKKKRNAHKTHQAIHQTASDNVARERHEHTLAPEDCSCATCGHERHVIGGDTTYLYRIEQPIFTIEEHVELSYGCRHCEMHGIATPIVKGPSTPRILKGRAATPEAIAHIICEKFVSHSPFYRQQQHWERQGISLSRQTMSNWSLEAADQCLAPVVDHMHDLLLKQEIIHSDDTGIQVLHEVERDNKKSNSFMWVYQSGQAEAQQIVLYDYTAGHSYDIPSAYLKGFTGYLQTDGFKGYQKADSSFTNVGCWAHYRRKYAELLAVIPVQKRSAHPATVGLAHIDDLFKYEKVMKDQTIEERIEIRKKAKELVDTHFEWVKAQFATPKSPYEKALNYGINQELYLRRYLDDVRLEMSNNRAERSIKPFVLSRKNFLFANTTEGAHASALIFSVIETAKMNQINPYDYLVWLLKKTMTTDLSDQDELDKLMPWRYKEESI